MKTGLTIYTVSSCGHAPMTHWVLVVMDQFTRRIIVFGVHAGDVDSVALCRMFNTAISTSGVPTYLSSDNDLLFLYHRWQANLPILHVDEIKTIPYTPCSHPFAERLIGTIRHAKPGLRDSSASVSFNSLPLIPGTSEFKTRSCYLVITGEPYFRHTRQITELGRSIGIIGAHWWSTEQDIFSVDSDCAPPTCGLWIAHRIGSIHKL